MAHDHLHGGRSGSRSKLTREQYNRVIRSSESHEELSVALGLSAGYIMRLRNGQLVPVRFADEDEDHGKVREFKDCQYVRSPHSLQRLPPEKFTEAVNRIIAGEDLLGSV